MSITTSIQTIEFEGVYFLQVGEEFFKGCKRCGGTGHYSHNGEHDRCYECDGDFEAALGERLGDRAAAERWAHGVARRRAAALAKRQTKQAKMVAKMEEKQEALKAIFPEVYEFLMTVSLGGDFYRYETEEEYEEARKQGLVQDEEKNEFLLEMARNLRYPARANWAFTDNMAKAVRRVMDRQAAKAAEPATPAPAGRVIVTGTVLSTKITENEYGVTYKMTVKSDEGFRVYVSMAGNLAEGINYSLDEAKGRRVTFTATLEASKDDESFAFGSRPTKAAWL